MNPCGTNPELTTEQGKGEKEHRAMTITLTNEQARHLTLEAQSAEDIMTPHVTAIEQTASINEAVRLLADKGFSGLPVVDAGGQAVGVLTRADIVAHDCEGAEDLSAPQAGDPLYRVARKAPRRTDDDQPAKERVKDIMNPVIFSVARDTPVNIVVDAMLGLNVHRLFVTDSNETVVGVISTLDILRHLKR
jgi:CBS domain-containing protein